MHKRKDGKIIASLTEVKNKTGDIFALVDEFGEITLTSYNKPKYRITKVDIREMLQLSEESSEKQPEPEKKTILQKVTAAVSPKRQELSESTLVSAELISSLSDMKQWDRNTKAEIAIIQKISKPLQ